MKATPLTLEEIRRQRQALAVQLAQKRADVRRSYETLTEPTPEPRGQFARLLLRTQNLTYVFDAALLGFKLYRTFQRRPLLRWKK